MAQFRSDGNAARTPTRARRTLIVSVLLAGLAVAGCSSSDDDTSSTTAASASTGAPSVTVPVGAIVLDVRTPAEFAAGHLEGAQNLDVESPSFADGLAELDPSASYLVYCQSGRRSGLAVEEMVAAGFTAVTDLGGIAQAAATTQLAIVQ